MDVLKLLAVAIYYIAAIKAEDDDSNSLMTVFYANTGLGTWWNDPDYQTVADAQIDSLNNLDVDTICLTELSTDKIVTRFTDGLKDKYPYSYTAPRERRGTDEYQCNCSTTLYEETYSCLNDTITAGGIDYSDCFGVTRPPNHCLLCWTAYFDESIGLESIELCDGGNYTEPLGPPGEEGKCVYGDGRMNVGIFSKYPLSDTSNLIFTDQSLQYNGVIDAEIMKNDVNYHVFCTAFANYRHLDVMKSQANELSDYVNDGIQGELNEETMILLLGDFNAGEKGDCEECIDYPENDNGTIWNTVLDIDENIWSIYDNQFNENGDTVPKCTSCTYNPRNDADDDEYIGINALAFSEDYYMAKRAWLDSDAIESLNTSLSDKYAIIIYGDMDDTTIIIDTTEYVDEAGVEYLCSILVLIFANILFM